MKRTELERLIAEGRTQRAIAKELGVSQTSVRYWLRKFGLKTHRGPHNKNAPYPTSWKCKCGETDPSKFYGRKNKICAQCQNKYNQGVGEKKVAKIRKMLGGKCVLCGFDEYQCALDFHHLKPENKIASLRKMRGWSWKHIVEELPKGVLLCKNCHSAVTIGLAKV